MAKDKFPGTQAIRILKKHVANYTLHPYRYEEKGGTEVAAEALNIEEYQVIKTLVMEDDKKEPLLMLMHGNRQVSTKALSRALKAKTVKPCEPEMAHRHTGYFVGGVSPFGTKKELKIYIEASIMDLPRIYINAGRKGLLAEMSPKDLIRILDPIPVNVAI